MKKMLFPALLALLAIPAILTSCGDDGVDPCANETGLEGVYIGTHFLNIDAGIIAFLEDLIEDDSVNLRDGFVDTITVNYNSLDSSKVDLYSTLLDTAFVGNVTASNKFKIPLTSFDSLVLGGVVVYNATVQSTQDVVINCGKATVKLRLKGKIPGVPLPGELVEVPTSGTFTKQ